MHVEVAKLRTLHVSGIGLGRRKRGPFGKQSVAVRILTGDDVERPPARIDDERIQVHFQPRQDDRAADKEVRARYKTHARVLTARIVTVGGKTAPDRSKDAIRVGLASAGAEVCKQ